MRIHIRTVVLACTVALAIPSLWNPAHANVGRFDQLTYMTFSQPVALPGVTLPAGEYIFRLPDRAAARMVLQVLSSDRKTVLAMFPTRPTSREEASDDPMVVFHEAPPGATLPIRAWFYPGERFGLEFAYPEEQAKLIAEHSDVPVLTASLSHVE